jgi:hypothetical protein
MDPDVAVRVAMAEGGLNNPFRHGEGPAPRSQDPRFGAKENSYGPFQLYVSGHGAGLGDRAVGAGIDPTKDWQGGVNYALDEAARKGWGQWYGAAHVGIQPFQGIPRDGSIQNSAAPSVPTSAPSPYANMADGQKGQEAYAPPSSATSPPSSAIAQAAPPASSPYIPQSIANFANSSTGKSLGDMFGSMALMQQPKPLEAQPIRGPSPEQANALLTLVNSLKQMRRA